MNEALESIQRAVTNAAETVGPSVAGLGRGSGETVQMSFTGQGWVLVQPSEGQVFGAAQQSSSSSGGLGNLLNS